LAEVLLGLLHGDEIERLLIPAEGVTCQIPEIRRGLLALLIHRLYRRGRALDRTGVRFHDLPGLAINLLAMWGIRRLLHLFGGVEPSGLFRERLAQRLGLGAFGEHVLGHLSPELGRIAITVGLDKGLVERDGIERRPVTPDV